MPGYFSVKIICSEERTQVFERTNVLFEEQMMSMDK